MEPRQIWEVCIWILIMTKTKLIKNKQKNKVYTTIAVVGEGLTEHLYFNGLRGYEKSNFENMKVSFKPDKPPAKGRKCTEILQEAKCLIIDYDFVFCILDNDTIINCDKNLINYEESLNELKSFCRDYGLETGDKINIYIFLENLTSIDMINKNQKAIFILKNMPCLEFWYFLHFNGSALYHDKCSNVVNLLKDKKYLPGYSKSSKYYKKNIYSTLKSKLPDAITNAKSINEQRITDPDRDLSYSDLYILFHFLGIS